MTNELVGFRKLVEELTNAYGRKPNNRELDLMSSAYQRGLLDAVADTPARTEVTSEAEAI